MRGVVHNRIHQIIVRRFLFIRQSDIGNEHAVSILITFPADNSTILTDTIDCERRNRTALRNEFNRYLGQVRIVSDAKLREEHDISTHLSQEVTVIIIEADAIRIPNSRLKCDGIYSHKGIEVRRIGNHTHDNLAVIRRVSASPERYLEFVNRIANRQFRHDSVRTDIHGRRSDIII